MIEAYEIEFTSKQNYVLNKLKVIEITTASGKISYSLDGQDCRYQLISLAARGMIAWPGMGAPSKIADPVGINRSSWKHAGVAAV